MQTTKTEALQIHVFTMINTVGQNFVNSLDNDLFSWILRMDPLENMELNKTSKKYVTKGIHGTASEESITKNKW